jgi:hypothetical protein
MSGPRVTLPEVVAAAKALPDAERRELVRILSDLESQQTGTARPGTAGAVLAHVGAWAKHMTQEQIDDVERTILESRSDKEPIEW